METMVQLNPPHPFNATPQRILLWYGYYHVLPKPHRYSLGLRIDTLLIHAIEAIATASWLPREKKLPYVQIAIRKLDTVKLLLMILWETKSLDEKKYITLSLQFDEVGRQMGGWNGQLVKKNSPSKGGEK